MGGVGAYWGHGGVGGVEADWQGGDNSATRPRASTHTCNDAPSPHRHGSPSSLAPEDASGGLHSSQAWRLRCRITSRTSSSSGTVSAHCLDGPRHGCVLTRCATTTELDDIVSTRCQPHDHEIIDNALRSFLNVTTSYQGTRSGLRMWMLLCRRSAADCDQPSTCRTATASPDASPACCRASSSPSTRPMCAGRSYIVCCRYAENANRTNMHALTDPAQDDDNPTLHMVAAFLLFDGRNNQNDATFEMMHDEGVFARLVELIQLESVQEEPRLHQMLLELLYESSRIQRLRWEDFGADCPFACQPSPLGADPPQWPWTTPSYSISSAS